MFKSYLLVAWRNLIKNRIYTVINILGLGIGLSVCIVAFFNHMFNYDFDRANENFDEIYRVTCFRIDILTHFDNFLLMWNVKDSDWKFWPAALFLQIPDKSLLPSINQALKQYLPVQNKAREDFKVNRYSLIPLDDVGENSRTIWSSSLYPSLHPAAVIAPPVMAIFILLIACFNFANTSIAAFSKRLKEIALRKTFGGQRKQLVAQFMFETIIVCFLAMIVGVILAEFLVPAYSNLWAYMSIELTLTKYGLFWLFLFLLLLLTGFISGVYPAIHVSSLSPVFVMKGDSPFRGSGKLSAVLLTLQFTISVMSLVMGIVFARNADFQRTIDLGYDKDKLIVVPIPSEYYASFRNDILTNPNVISAEGTQQHIGWGGYRRPIKDNEKRLEADMLNVGPGYPTTMGLRLAEGRLFDELRASADLTNGSVIVNKKLVADFGWQEGVGHTFTLYDTTKFTVIGVVEDFYTSGLWNKIEPTVIRLSTSGNYGVIAVRAKTEDLAGVLDYLSQKWKSMGTNHFFGGQLQEDTMQEEKDINGSIMKINVFLAITATILSLIGMFNLVSLDIIKRTKEMGIRKIQGASVALLMLLTGKKFIIILLISSVLGCLGGYKLSLMLLDSIWDYFVDISAGMLLSAAGILIVSTVVTIIWKMLKAARRNPVDTLRYE